MSKTASGINYLGPVTVQGAVTSTQVETDQVDTKKVQADQVDTQVTKTNLIYINNHYFAFSEGTWTPEFGFVTDNGYADGWVPILTWNPNAVINTATGFYTRTGNNVSIYYEVDINSQGVSYISGGGINVENPGIRNLPFAFSPLPITDTEMEEECSAASWPNGIDGTTGAPIVYAPVFPYPYTARLVEKDETLTLRKIIGTGVGCTTVNGITRTFDGKTMYFYVQGETYDIIASFPPPIPPWKMTGQAFGTLTNLNFADTVTNYHILFNGEMTYRTVDP